MKTKREESILDIIANLERIADHAANIAEASIYSIQGTDIRHKGSSSDMK